MATIQDQLPVGVPSVSSGAITIHTMLQEPSRITRYLADIRLQNFFAAEIFNNGGGVSGGALVYDELTLNDLYLDAARGVQDVEPGAEFPIVTHSVGEPKVALVVKTGGKFDFADEARDRNDEVTFQRKARKLANGIVRDLNVKALAKLQAAVTAYTATQTVAGVNWGTVTSTAAASKTDIMNPIYDITKVNLAAEVAELGVELNTLIINPAQAAVLTTAFGAQNVDAILAANGITRKIVSNRVTAGTAFVLESGGVGEMRFEKGISTETWREPKNQVTWVQTDVRALMAVTDPYAVYQLTGLAG
jgi:hypothetical protein